MSRSSQVREFDLSAIAPGAWFDELGSQLDDFERVCEILGRRFFAFLVLAGFHLRSITLDPEDPFEPWVEFQVGESERVLNLPLSSFRVRVAGALLVPHETPRSLPATPDADALRDFIGLRYLYLAPLFGVRLLWLKYEHELPVITLQFQDRVEELTLATLQRAIDRAVRGELDNARRPAEFTIDTECIEQARKANGRRDYARTVRLLGSWPASAAALYRSARGRALSTGARTHLACALELLGTALLRLDKLELADEVLRLGIQWAPDTEVGAGLFLALGRAYVAADRSAEAIGLLRRALALGQSRAEVLPLLARCFVSRGRYVAAAGCLDAALSDGADPIEHAALRRELLEALGSPYQRLKALLAE